MAWFVTALHTVAFEAVRILGAGYLVWLGIAIFRSRSGTTDTDTEGRMQGTSLRSAAFRGLLTNLLNPILQREGPRLGAYAIVSKVRSGRRLRR